MGLLSALGTGLDFVTGGSGLFSALGAGLDSESGAREQNQQSAAMAREQMQFQEHMSSTAYQRAVNDMKMAGLNPMLAYSQGGASTPGGASVKFENVKSAGTASAAQAAGTVANLQSVAANTEQVRAMTDKIRSETLEQQINTARALAEIASRKTETLHEEDKIRRTRVALKEDQRAYSAREAGNAWADDVRRRKAEADLAQLEIPAAKSQAEFYDKLGATAPGMKWLFEILRGFRGISGR